MAESGVLAAGHSPSGFRKLLVPGASAFLLTLFLIGLGVWQLYRLQWKLAILAEIRASESQPGVPLTDHPGPYAKVVVTGRLQPELAVLFGDQVHQTPAGIEQGGQLVVPLERASGVPVLVDLGWVPLSDKNPATLPQTVTTIAGYVQSPRHAGFLSAPDDLAKRRFFTLDPEKIGEVVGLGKVAPFTLIRLGKIEPGVYPMPAEHLPHPPNNHLEYALTWFGLAMVVVFEFAFWARDRLRR